MGRRNGTRKFNRRHGNREDGSWAKGLMDELRPRETLPEKPEELSVKDLKLGGRVGPPPETRVPRVTEKPSKPYYDGRMAMRRKGIALTVAALSGRGKAIGWWMSGGSLSESAMMPAHATNVWAKIIKNRLKGPLNASEREGVCNCTFSLKESRREKHGPGFRKNLTRPILQKTRQTMKNVSGVLSGNARANGRNSHPTATLA